MTRFVPYVSDEDIEKDAQVLLAEFVQRATSNSKRRSRSTTSSKST